MKRQYALIAVSLGSISLIASACAPSSIETGPDDKVAYQGAVPGRVGGVDSDGDGNPDRQFLPGFVPTPNDGDDNNGDNATPTPTPGFSGNTPTPTPTPTPVANVPTPPPEVTICNPFGGYSPGSEGGLRGLLSFRDDMTFTSFSDPAISGLKTTSFFDGNFSLNLVSAKRGSPKIIYVDNLNIPTRAFSQGFYTMSNQSQPLSLNGQMMIEFFGVHFESRLSLAGHPAGKYEFALLSDDGAVMRAWNGSSFETIVSNDATQGSRFRRSTKILELKEGQSLPITVSWFQGPRYHIALIAMWRYLGTGDVQAPAEPLDGYGGNDVYFDWENHLIPEPKQAYTDLMNRGWEVIPSQSFSLPQGETNPCVGQ